MTQKKTKTDATLAARILEAALPDVAFDGWSPELLERAGARLKLSAEDIASVFPHGAHDMVLYFSSWADEKMLKQLPAKKMAEMRVRDRISAGVRARLEALTPHKQAVGAALAFLAPPPRSLNLPKLVWQTADVLWRAAGDTATDYNYYTKRILLSGVLTSTTLFWLNDKSEGHARTWEFLSRRIDNVLKIGGAIGNLKRKRGATA